MSVEFVKLRPIAAATLLAAFLSLSAFAQSTEFSYQGFFADTSAPANGTFDFEFRLYSAPSGGSLEGTNSRPSVLVTNGVFSVTLDFGAGAFPGADRYLEIRVKPTSGTTFTTLSPRQKLGRAPYAISSVTADVANVATTANNALSLNGFNSAQFVQTNDPRLTDARNPLPNSSNYIQNSTSVQSSSNFNVSGNGTVLGTFSGGTINATTQYNAGGGRVLAKFGQNNLYVGTLAGQSNGGIQNTMVGDSAGKDNTGNENSMFGFIAGQNSLGGGFNSFFGSRSGAANSTGSGLSLFGANADLGSNNLQNAGAFGLNAFVETSNSLVLGSVNGRNTATADTFVGIGTTAPDATLDIAGQLPDTPPNVPNLRITNYGRFSLIRGRRANGTRTNPTAVTSENTLLTLTADGYTGSAFTGLGQASIFFRATENWNAGSNGTAIDFATTPNGSTIENLRMRIDENGFVGIGTTTPARRLDVDGIVRVGNIGGTIGCIEDRDGTVIAGTCASDSRYKKNISSFGKVLNNFAKLRPVTYFWRADEFADQKFGERQSFGLIAQEVEELFPDLVVTDEKGFKAINYSKLPLLTIQAVKELKAENDLLKEMIDRQNKLFAEQTARIEQQKAALAKLQAFVYRPRPVKSRKSRSRRR